MTPNSKFNGCEMKDVDFFSRIFFQQLKLEVRKLNRASCYTILHKTLVKAKRKLFCHINTQK